MRTGGAFDVTVGPLSHLWRRARRQSELPQPRRGRGRARGEWIRAGAPRRGVSIGEACARGHAPRLRRDRQGLCGRPRPRRAARRRACGARSSSRAATLPPAMPPPGESGWRVAIAPFDAATPAATRSLTLAEAAVSTSGDAEQWVEIGGVRYSHIFDPRTGRPLTGHRQATVVARDATTSDMLATTLCVLGRRMGCGWPTRTPGRGGHDCGDRWRRAVCGGRSRGDGSGVRRD